MSFKTPKNRAQPFLLPPSIDDFVKPDNPVIAIDAYVDSLDLAALGFFKPPAKHNSGQPAFHPNQLLKLYLYGYMNQVRSSRKLEREAQRNLELIWLLGQLTPSYKTIADFRKSFAVALKNVNKEFVLLCKSLNLIGGELIAIDGSFFHGNASKGTIHQKTKLHRQLESLDKQIAEYQQTLDTNDKADDALKLKSLCSDEQLAEKLEQLKQIQLKKQSLINTLEVTGDTQISTTDPDARLLNKGNGTLAGYNVQNAVDEKNKLIIHTEVVNDTNDRSQLAPMATVSKAVLGVDCLEVVADAGYFKQADIKICDENQITVYVPEPKNQGVSRSNPELNTDKFSFDEERNLFICPTGMLLKPQGNGFERSGTKRVGYASKETDCRVCPLKTQCLPKKGLQRQLYKSEHDAFMKEFRTRMSDSKEKMRLRSAIVEHPFGTIKRRAGWDHFLVRGFEKVRGEWGIMALCYNLTRVMNIMGVEAFTRYCQSMPQKA